MIAATHKLLYALLHLHVIFKLGKRLVSTGEEDADAIVVEGSKASGIGFNFLDSTIESLGNSIHDRMGKVVQ